MKKKAAVQTNSKYRTSKALQSLSRVAASEEAQGEADLSGAGGVCRLLKPCPLVRSGSRAAPTPTYPRALQPSLGRCDLTHMVFYSFPRGGKQQKRHFSVLHTPQK